MWWITGVPICHDCFLLYLIPLWRCFGSCVHKVFPHLSHSKTCQNRVCRTSASHWGWPCFWSTYLTSWSNGVPMRFDTILLNWSTLTVRSSCVVNCKTVNPWHFLLCYSESRPATSSDWGDSRNCYANKCSHCKNLRSFTRPSALEWTTWSPGHVQKIEHENMRKPANVVRFSKRTLNMFFFHVSMFFCCVFFPHMFSNVCSNPLSWWYGDGGDLDRFYHRRVGYEIYDTDTKFQARDFEDVEVTFFTGCPPWPTAIHGQVVDSGWCC